MGGKRDRQILIFQALVYPQNGCISQGWAWPKSGPFCLSPVLHCRELDCKWSSQDSNRHPKGCRHCRRWQPVKHCACPRASPLTQALQLLFVTPAMIVVIVSKTKARQQHELGAKKYPKPNTRKGQETRLHTVMCKPRHCSVLCQILYTYPYGMPVLQVLVFTHHASP